MRKEILHFLTREAKIWILVRINKLFRILLNTKEYETTKYVSTLYIHFTVSNKHKKNPVFINIYTL